jgi:hypothetical protein
MGYSGSTVRESGAGRTEAPFIYGLSEAKLTQPRGADPYSFGGRGTGGVCDDDVGGDVHWTEDS